MSYGVIPVWRKKGEIIPFKIFRTKKQAEKWVEKDSKLRVAKRWKLIRVM